MHHHAGGTATLIDAARDGRALGGRQFGPGGTSDARVAVPQAGGPGTIGLDIPFNENGTGSWPHRREYQILHLHVSNISRLADLKHGLWVAVFV